MKTAYAICFDIPETGDAIFAGWYKGALGFATTLATAAYFDTYEEAERTLANGYGESMKAIGSVVEAERP
jgi:hypothetical protein